RITHFVAGAGTCGTITGVATYLKAQNPEIQIIAADPEGSVFSGGSGRPYLVEGVGEDFFPDAWNTDLYDGIIAVSDADSFSMARRVARTEGILVGGSGGMAVAAALRVAAAAGPDDLVVVLNPDSGRGYLSKVFNDDWMANFGFTTSSGPTLADAIERSGGPRDLLYVNPEQPVREAIDVMRTNGISQLPVCKNTPPFAAAEVMGSVDELVLMRAAADDRATLDLPVESVLGPSLPTIGIGQEVNLAIEQLRTATALLVLGGGRPCCILTRSDVLEFLEFGDDLGGDRHVD
ncbi:MAG: pyridoxal-phosphate dependent enzyme, partial [Candidatus Microthrix subdominans]